MQVQRDKMEAKQMSSGNEFLSKLMGQVGQIGSPGEQQ